MRISALTWDDLPVRIGAQAAERDETVQKRDERLAELERTTDSNMRAAIQNDLLVAKYQLDIRTRLERNLQAELYARGRRWPRVAWCSR